MKSYRIMTFEEVIEKARKETEGFVKLSSWAEKLYKNNGNKIMRTDIKPHYFSEDNIKKKGFDLIDIFFYFDLRSLTARERNDIISIGKKLVFYEEINNVDENNNLLFNF